MQYETSKRGLDMIKYFEGYREKSYRCSAGIWTIGYGSTRYGIKEPVKQGDKITKRSAERLLKEDIKYFEDKVNRLIKVELTGNQFDALISFTYNLGPQALEGSTLLWKLNREDFTGASEEFIRWTKARDPITAELIELPGLVARRKAEQRLFDTEV